MLHKYLLAPLLALLLAAAPHLAQAQTGAVGIGTTAPAASAALDVSSTTKGLLPPRLSTTQRDAIAGPAAGLTIYNTSTNKLNTWNGSSWTESLSSTEQPAGPGSTYTFAYTGAPQTFTVPAGVTSIRFDARGAQGGSSNNSGYGSPNYAGGKGARVQATLAVTPGQVFTLYVGGSGSPATIDNSQQPSGGGYNGGGDGGQDGYVASGGGGGATDVRTGNATLADRLLVAAGGGGGGFGYSGAAVGGMGGAPNGGPGGSSGGAGATQVTGNALGQGGSSQPNDMVAGGGGGYYGGLAGDSYYGGGGGGGSSYVTASGSTVVLAAGATAGNGVLVLSLNPTYAAPALDASNFVNVPGDNLGNHTATQNLNLSSYQLVGGTASQPGTTGLSVGSTGSVGIGVSGLTNPLAVVGSGPAAQLLLRNSGGGSGSTTALDFQTYAPGAATDPSGASLRAIDDGVASASLSFLTKQPGVSANPLVERLRITSGGNVGIGTSSAPSQKLEVAGQVFSNTGGFRFPDNTVQTTATVPGSFIQNQTALQSGASFNISGNGYVAGRVGIGTTSPGYPLTVQAGASNRVLGLNNAAGTDRYNLSLGSTGLSLSESSSGSSRLFVQDGTGNVGLGTSSPGQRLDVAGNANVSGNTTVAGQVGIGTTAPDASAALEVKSTSQGLLPPRLTTAQRDAIASPATGLVLYNTNTGKLNTWNGTSWDATITEQPYQGPATRFAYTGQPQTYTVPAGVTSLQVDAAGASGGSGGGNNAGGGGARVQATLAVSPGQVLTIYVAGAGSFGPASGGYNGGGDSQSIGGGAGGGATDVRSGSGQLSDRLLVAGGGGGCGYTIFGSQGGAGGNPNGGNNGSLNSNGKGATQTAGGNAGGSLGTGGSYSGNFGGGGGGGYYGGGSGESGGGGGSSWVTPSSSGVTMTGGYQAGNGYLTLTPGLVYTAPVLSGVNITGVPGTWSVNGTNYYYSGGNVGIGTSTPGQKLDVAGNTNVSGSSTVGGLLTAGSVTVTGATTVSGTATLTGATTLAGATAINTTGTASTTIGSGTGAVILPGLSTAGFVTNSASGQLGTTSAASLGTTFILNQSSQQTGGNFNVSGAGTVGGTLTAGAASITNNTTVGGSLGVGVSTPAGQLANTGSNVIATDGNGISAQGLGWVNTSAVGYAGVFYNANNVASGDGLAVKVASTSAVALDVSQGTAAGTAGTSLLRVSGSGSVGIGTPTPSQKLDVAGNANVSGNTTVGGNTTISGNGYVSGSVGIGTSSPAAGLHIDRPESGNSTALGVLLSGGTSGNPSIELRGSGKSPYIDFVENTGLDYSTRLLSQAGTLNLSYGGTATQPTYLFKVNGGLQCTTLNQTSDARFKQHVRPIGSALASVLALRGVRYEWNALGIKHGGTAGAPQVGLLAQEVEKIFPELVSTDAQGYKAVNYAQLTPVLIEALKEQQAQIEALKARAASAEAKASSAETKAATAETQAAKATATLETFEARLRRLEAGNAQAQR